MRNHLHHPLGDMSLETEESFIDRISRGNEQTQSDSEKELSQIVHQHQHVIMQQSQAALEDLFAGNSTRPLKVRNVQFSNSQDFRDSFLQHQIRGLLSEKPVKLADFLSALSHSYSNLVKLDILEQCVVSVHSVPPQGRSSRNSAFSSSVFPGSGPSFSAFSPTSASASVSASVSLKDRLKANQSETMEVVPVFSLIPQKRFYAKTGTNIGNGEGDGYIQFQLKNLFGGAESVVFDAISGTKTPSSYLLNYSQPILNDARFLWDSSAFTHTRNLDWMQGSVDTKGMAHKISSRLGGAWNFDVALESAWRRLSNNGSKSLEVMVQSKDTLKTSVLFNLKYDTRDHHVTPSRGQYFRLGLEKSGFFRFNNVAYTKIVAEGQMAASVQDHTLLVTQKAGALFNAQPGPSSILDRFHAGGPNDVRAFSVQGLGPKSANSSVGGDFFVSGGVSLISHIPYTPKDTGFKMHNFLNFGKVVCGGISFPEALKQFKSEYSVGYGFGILYNHPQTRFEVNFVLPLAAHSGDSIRKGFQCGVGMSFL